MLPIISGPRPSRRTAAAIFAVLATLLPSVDVVAPLLDSWDSDESAEEVSGVESRGPVVATSRSLHRPHVTIAPEDAGPPPGDAIAVLVDPRARFPALGLDSGRLLRPRAPPLAPPLRG